MGCTPMFAARIGKGPEGIDRGEQEPSQPDTFTTAVRAHVVHSVIPVPRADQRQAVSAERQTGIDRPRNMLI